MADEEDLEAHSGSTALLPDNHLPPHTQQPLIRRSHGRVKDQHGYVIVVSPSDKEPPAESRDLVMKSHVSAEEERCVVVHVPFLDSYEQMTKIPARKTKRELNQFSDNHQNGDLNAECRRRSGRQSCGEDDGIYSEEFEEPSAPSNVNCCNSNPSGKAGVRPRIPWRKCYDRELSAAEDEDEQDSTESEELEDTCTTSYLKCCKTNSRFNPEAVLSTDKQRCYARAVSTEEGESSDRKECYGRAFCTEDRGNFDCCCLKRGAMNGKIVNFMIENNSKEYKWLKCLGGRIKSHFPLHEKPLREFLTKNWGDIRAMFKLQPLNLVRAYYGEQVCMYFAWLGWYTHSLLASTLVGLAAFLYGVITFNSNTVSQEICGADDLVMCPLCDEGCSYWRLSDTCTFAKVAHLFDNGATVLFAVFMAVWATVFLEMWKRYRAVLACRWDLLDMGEQEDELVLDKVTRRGVQWRPAVRAAARHAAYRAACLLLVVIGCFLMICFEVAAAYGIVAYRVLMRDVMSRRVEPGFFRNNAGLVVVGSGAVLHFLLIQFMNKICSFVASKLANIEDMSLKSRERRFCIIIFIFQFINNFSSIFYVAFFLGRFIGRPGNYARWFEEYRLEECHPSGCLIDLCVQMAIVLFLKQLFNNLMEFGHPYCCNKLSSTGGRKVGSRECSATDTWQDDLLLQEPPQYFLSYEYLEMVLQFGFVTIFVAAFPLAPLLALGNNLLEIRIDAWKLCCAWRRPVARRAHNIGVWFGILEFLGVVAVITNALVIAVTSDFIPRLVYIYAYGPCAGQGHYSAKRCLHGYVNSSLSVFHVSHLENLTQPSQDLSDSHTGNYCRYRDYRHPSDSDQRYEFTPQYWFIFTARFAFIFVFEHLVVGIKVGVAWLIPDIPLNVKKQILKKKAVKYRKKLNSINKRRKSPSFEPVPPPDVETSV